MDQKESLSDLIDHYEELGLEGMQQVFQSRYGSPGTYSLRLLQLDWLLRFGPQISLPLLICSVSGDLGQVPRRNCFAAQLLTANIE